MTRPFISSAGRKIWVRFVSASAGCSLLLAFITGLTDPRPTRAEQLRFEVASVKPNLSGSGNSTANGSDRAGSLTFENVTLIACISRAYGVKVWQIVGPDWLASERYDIGARAGTPLAPGQMSQMLQALLTERFHLATHRESRTLRGYGLVPGRNGPKLRQAQSDGHSSFNSNTGHMVARHLSLAQFADALAGQLKGPVRDMTGLKGAFDFTLDFSSDDNPTDAAAGPSIFTALEEQLGLKLEAERAPFDVIVVDHAEKIPTEN